MKTIKNKVEVCVYKSCGPKDDSKIHNGYLVVNTQENIRVIEECENIVEFYNR